VRTCVGCRRRDAREALVRLAIAEEPDGPPRIVAWGAKSSGASRPRGRGASVHPDASCLRAALSSNAFARVFARRFPGRVGQMKTIDEAQLLSLILKGS
jgi:uncharacterized protein